MIIILIKIIKDLVIQISLNPLFFKIILILISKITFNMIPHLIIKSLLNKKKIIIVIDSEVIANFINHN